MSNDQVKRELIDENTFVLYPNYELNVRLAAFNKAQPVFTYIHTEKQTNKQAETK